MLRGTSDGGFFFEGVCANANAPEIPPAFIHSGDLVVALLKIGLPADLTMFALEAPSSR